MNKNISLLLAIGLCLATAEARPTSIAGDAKALLPIVHASGAHQALVDSSQELATSWYG